MLPFLASNVPYLSLDDLSINIQALSSKLDPDGGLGFEAELVYSEPREKIGLSYSKIADENHLEETEGIFRINVDNSQEEYVRDQLNHGIVLDGIDVHCLVGLIKNLLRSIFCVSGI
ncbi:uncharacterized protein A4U43_C09F3190 [Asparagus officinalis]|uniref:Uncharacterized protein n=1 Tax=Asparagus officinalis TaxID=4686 RepID=A0A5P1E571_ASPOF|nr:uncharacterized protein A4U43_C09F3190 [Asparagus officinalis]